MNSVNLNEFLAPRQKNLIMIMYNQEYFTQVFESKADFAPLKGKWLFVEYKDGTGRFISPTEFILNSQEFNINAFYEILETAYAKWQRLMPKVPFPDVQISTSEDRSAFLSYDKTNARHIIFLGLRDIESLDKFKFTIGHELGHLYFFFSGLQEQVNIRLKQKQFKEFMPWSMVALGGASILFNGYIIYQNEHVLVNLFALIQVVAWSLYLSANILSRKRLENYSMEFFSDFFSLSFLGKPETDSCGLNSGGWNGFTHPAGNWRLSLIKNTPENCLLHEWDNPVERHSYKFRVINFYEMEFTLSFWFHSLYLPLKGKVLTYLKKQRKIKL